MISFLSKIFELIFWVILLFKVLFWVKILFWEIFWGLFWANLLFWGLFWVTFLESDACVITFTFLRTFKSPFFCQLLFWGLLKVLFFLLFPTQNLYAAYKCSQCYLHTPYLKQLKPGSERPFLETCFFLHFSLRLSGKNYSRVISMGNFGPTASNLRYEILTNFWVKIRVLVRPHLWSWTGFDLLIISWVKFWWFSFFLFPP